MKKLTNSQLVYNLTSARNNKTEHPTQEGRDFFAEKEIPEEKKRPRHPDKQTSQTHQTKWTNQTNQTNQPNQTNQTH